MTFIDDIFSEDLTTSGKKTNKAGVSNDTGAFNGVSETQDNGYKPQLSMAALGTSIFSGDYDNYNFGFQSNKEKVKSNVNTLTDFVGDVADTVGGAYKGITSFVGNTWDYYVNDKNTEAGINDISKFTEYNEKIEQYSKEGNIQEAQKWKNKLLDESIINQDIYNDYISKQNKLKEESNFSDDTKKEFIESVSSELGKTTDSFTQDLIEEGASEMVDQLNDINEIIKNTDATTFDKEGYKKALEGIKEKTKEFYKGFANEILQTGDDEQAYYNLIAQDKYKNIAKEISDFYLLVRDDSVSSTTQDNFNEISGNKNALQKVGNFLLGVSNIMSQGVNKGGTLLEGAKQKGLGEYDITEELAHLGVFKEGDTFLNSAGNHIKYYVDEFIDGSPQFVPEIVSMLTGGKALEKLGKVTKVTSFIDKLANPYARKAAVGASEFSKDMLMYDMLGRGFLDRGTTSEDMIQDLLISGGVNSIIGALSSPIAKSSKQYLDTLNKYDISGVKIDDEIIDIANKGDIKGALALSIKKQKDGSLGKITKKGDDVLKTLDTLHSNYKKGLIDSTDKINIEAINKGLDRGYDEQVFKKFINNRIDDAKKVISKSSKQDQDIINKTNLIITKDAKNKGIITNDEIKDALEQESKYLNKSSLDLSKEETEAALDIANLMATGDGSITKYNNVLSGEEGKKIIAGTKKILSGLDKLIHEEDLIQEGAILGRYIKTQNGYLDLINGNALTKEDILKTKTKKSGLNYFNTYLSKVNKIVNKDFTDVDITSILKLSDFIKGKGIKDGKTATSVLKNSLSGLGMKFINGQIVATKKQLIVFKNTLEKFNRGDVEFSELSKEELSVLKIIFLKDTYLDFEKKYILSLEKNPTSEITKKAFDNYGINVLWKEKIIRNEGTGIFHIDIKNGNKISAGKIIKKILNSGLTNNQKSKEIKKIKVTDNVISDKKMGVSNNKILEEHIEASSKIINREENKALKNKVKKVYNNTATKVSEFSDKDQIKVLTEIKTSDTLTPSTISNISVSEKQIQEDLITDVLKKNIIKDKNTTNILDNNIALSKLKSDRELILMKKILSEDEYKEYIKGLEKGEIIFKVDNANYNKQLSNNSSKELLDLPKISLGESKKKLLDINNDIIYFIQKNKDIDGLKGFKDFLIKAKELEDNLHKLKSQLNNKSLDELSNNLKSIQNFIDIFKDSSLLKKLQKQLNNVNTKKELLEGLQVFLTSVKYNIKNNDFSVSYKLFKNKKYNDILSKTLEETKGGYSYIDNIKDINDKGFYYFFKSNKLLEHLGTEQGIINDRLKNILTDNTIKKKIIVNDISEINSTRYDKLDLNEDSVVYLSSILKGDYILDKDTKYLLGKKIFYTYFNNFGDTIGLRMNDERFVKLGLSIDGVTHFLNNLDNIVGTDLKLNIKNGKIVADGNGLYSLKNYLIDAGILKNSETIIHYDSKQLLNQNEVIAFNNYQFQNKFFEFLYTGEFKKTKIDENILKVYDNVFDLSKGTKVDDVLNSSFLISNISFIYMKTLKQMLGDAGYSALVNTKIRFEDVLINGKVLDKIDKIIIDKANKIGSDINANLFQERNKKILESMNELDLKDGITKLYSSSELVDEDFLDDYVLQLLKNTEENSLTILSSLPIYIRNKFIPTLDQLFLNEVLVSIFNKTGLSISDFNAELIKNKKRLVDVYINKSKHNKIFNKIFNVKSFGKYKKNVDTGGFRDILVFNLFKGLKSEGIINKDVNIIGLIESIDSADKTKLINSIEKLKTQTIYDKEGRENYLVGVLSNILKKTDTKSEASIISELDSVDISEALQVASITTRDNTQVLKDYISSNLGTIFKKYNEAIDNIIEHIKIKDINIDTEFKDATGDIFKLNPFNYKILGRAITKDGKYIKEEDLLKGITDKTIKQDIGGFIKNYEEGYLIHDELLQIESFSNVKLDISKFKSLFKKEEHVIVGDNKYYLKDLLGDDDKPTEFFYNLMGDIVDKVKDIRSKMNIEGLITSDTKNIDDFSIFNFKLTNASLGKKYNDNNILEHPLFGLIKKQYEIGDNVNTVEGFFEELRKNIKLSMFNVTKIDHAKTKLFNKINEFSGLFFQRIKQYKQIESVKRFNYSIKKYITNNLILDDDMLSEIKYLKLEQYTQIIERSLDNNIKQYLGEQKYAEEFIGGNLEGMKGTDEFFSGDVIGEYTKELGDLNELYKPINGMSFLFTHQKTGEKYVLMYKDKEGFKFGKVNYNFKSKIGEIKISKGDKIIKDTNTNKALKNLNDDCNL